MSAPTQQLSTRRGVTAARPSVASSATFWAFLALLTSTILFANNAYAAGQGLALKSINPLQRTELAPTNQLNTIAMIYQPGCKWCKKQGKTLASLQKQCGDKANIALIGDDGTPSTLKRELRHFDKRLPAFSADKAFLRKIKGVEAYPTTVIFDPNGQLLVKKRGYVDEQKLKQIMGLITNQTCSVN